jgi:hypothetical protein
MSRDELQGARIVPKAVDKGAFNDQLEGLQRGSATQPVGPVDPNPGRTIK